MQHTYKLVAFDMDDTLITTNTWWRFNTFLGVSDEDDYRLYTAFSKKEISYETWLTELLSLYNIPRTEINREAVTTTLKAFELSSGATEAVAACRHAGIPTAIITGSFDITARAVATALEIDHVRANTRCVFTPDNLLTDLQSDGDEEIAKLAKLQALCTELAIDITDVLVVGDGANDIPMFDATGNGVTFSNAKQPVKDSARHTITDLGELPTLLS